MRTYEGLTGAEAIAAERERQLTEEGFAPAHDDEHRAGELALAAVCYAAPERIYVRSDYAAGLSFDDPWPWPGEYCDKRFGYGENRDNASNVAPDPGTYTVDEQIDLLVKAGAFIAAEIDRLRRFRGEDEEPER